MSIWYKNNESVVLRRRRGADWYERWDFEWKCWTIGRFTHLILINEGWVRYA